MHRSEACANLFNMTHCTEEEFSNDLCTTQQPLVYFDIWSQTGDEMEDVQRQLSQCQIKSTTTTNNPSTANSKKGCQISTHVAALGSCIPATFNYENQYRNIALGGFIRSR